MPLADQTSMRVALPFWCPKRLATPLGLADCFSVLWGGGQPNIEIICKKLPCHLSWGLGVGEGQNRVLYSHVSSGTMLNKSCVRPNDIAFMKKRGGCWLDPFIQHVWNQENGGGGGGQHKLYFWDLWGNKVPSSHK